MLPDIQGFRVYLTELELSPATISLYTGTVTNYSQEYSRFDKASLIGFKDDLMKRYSPRTVSLRLSAMRAYCEYAGIPCSINQVKIQKVSHIENIITAGQYRHLMSCLEKDSLLRWIVNIKMISMTGARISEALRMTKADVLRGSAEMQTKGKIRTIQIPQKLTDELMEYIQPFPETDTVIRSRNGRPMDRKSYANVLKSFSRYGIPKEVLHPHSFRHFFAIEFLRRNQNVSLLADLLGHSTVNTTMIYLRMSQEQQKRMIDDAVVW